MASRRRGCDQRWNGLEPISARAAASSCVSRQPSALRGQGCRGRGSAEPAMPGVRRVAGRDRDPRFSGGLTQIYFAAGSRSMHRHGQVANGRGIRIHLVHPGWIRVRRLRAPCDRSQLCGPASSTRSGVSGPGSGWPSSQSNATTALSSRSWRNGLLQGHWPGPSVRSHDPSALIR